MTSHERSRTEANKQVVTAFYEEAHFGGDVDGAIARYVGDTYTQHTPAAEDGVEGLRDYINAFLTTFLTLRVRYVASSLTVTSLPCTLIGPV
ncbi:nuclear transport factor 2 family protein [Mycobacterium interjectum]|uniref:nuclear transport factor 2 family protein n=1 Tax=Mycobacterium interjectum TaxID=33895 RepID=UPI00082CC47C|nr:hypothetical protein [Mycobacterium interjectum]